MTIDLEPFVAELASYLDRMLPQLRAEIECVYFEWNVSIHGKRFTPKGCLYGYVLRVPADLGAWDWVSETPMFEPEHDDDWDPLAFVARLGMHDEILISEAMSEIIRRGAARSAAVASFLATGRRLIWAEHDTRPTEVRSGPLPD